METFRTLCSARGNFIYCTRNVILSSIKANSSNACGGYSDDKSNNSYFSNYSSMRRQTIPREMNGSVCRVMKFHFGESNISHTSRPTSSMIIFQHGVMRFEDIKATPLHIFYVRRISSVLWAHILFSSEIYWFFSSGSVLTGRFCCSRGQVSSRFVDK